MTSTLTAGTARPDTREMIVVHNVFRRLFGDLPRLVRNVADGDTERAATLSDCVVEAATALHHHHTGEDELLWPKLLDRVRADQAFVLRAEEQHERVHEAIECALGRVNVFRLEARAGQRDALADSLDHLNAAVCEHMADEENYILPLVEAHLSVAEWAALGERGRANMPKDRLLIHLGWILDGLDASDRREILRDMPLPARVAWRLIGRRAFQKELRRVYGD
jgi:hemerythrin-like domain-containing protein